MDLVVEKSPGIPGAAEGLEAELDLGSGDGEIALFLGGEDVVEDVGSAVGSLLEAFFGGGLDEEPFKLRGDILCLCDGTAARFVEDDLQQERFAYVDVVSSREHLEFVLSLAAFSLCPGTDVYGDRLGFLRLSVNGDGK